MSGIASFVYKRRKLTVIVWILLLVGITSWSQRIGSAYSDSFTLPNTESTHALNLLMKYQHQESGASIQVVFASKDGRPLVKSDIFPVDTKLQTLTPTVVQVVSPFQSGAISPDGNVAFTTVYLNGTGRSIPDAAVKNIISQARSFSTSHLQVELLGNVVQQANQTKPGASEGFALLMAFFILLVTFGSVVATLVPLLVAVVGLGILSSSVSLFSHLFSTAQFAPILAALVGLGVGIDYALFIVTRFRQELHGGASVEESVRTALKTSGRAVLFAGIIVCIALLGLFTVHVSFLYGVAIAAALSVLVTMSASITLLPALLSMVGPRIDNLSLPGRRKKTHDIESGGWARWATAIQKRPIRVALAAIVLLGALCIPATSIRLGSADSGNDAKGTTTRAAYDLLSKGFGAGYSGPLTIVADVPRGANTTPLLRLENALLSDPDTAKVSPPMSTPDGKLAIITLFPKSSPESKATSDLINRLRTSTIPIAMGKSSIKIYVGGTTAIFTDFAHVLDSKLPLFFGSVVLLSFLLLLFLFRSLLIPLKAAIMNLLSIGAAFGVLVAIFQWGWGGSLLNVKGGPIEAFLPVMLFAILFGLSMDYEVFLVSRIQEEYLKTGNNAAAVRRGLAATGGVITAAATIMFSVFIAFVFGGQRVIQEFGIGLAAAVAFDATIIRSALVPALMQWWGPANWWLPSWLDRLLPKIKID
jgi:RND superfamily putative drug exporter